MALAGANVVINLSDGSTQVSFQASEFERFLEQYGVHNVNERDGFTSKLKTGGVYPDALNRNDHRSPAPNRPKNSQRDMWFLRAGKVPVGGKVPTGQKEINKCLEPPRLNRRRMKAQDNLQEAVADLIFEYYTDKELLAKAQTVRDWVLRVPTSVPPATPSPPPRTPTRNNRTGSIATGTGTSDLLPHGSPGVAFRPSKKQNTSSTPQHLRPPPSPKRLATNDELNLPITLRKSFPTLNRFMPQLLQRGKRMMKGMDLDQVQMNAALREMVRFKEEKGEAIGFDHGNGHGVSPLIPLSTVTTRDGKAKHNVEAFVDDVFRELEGDEQEEFVYGLLDVLLAKKSKDLVMKKLREHQLAPKVMDEFDMAAVL
ncbi:hypothetical protein ACHAWF_010402 [Thalassiosira exigua]